MITPAFEALPFDPPDDPTSAVPFIPRNFRAHRFNLFGDRITIGGMAAPHNNFGKEDEVFKYLKDEQNRDVLIGLHEQDFTADAQRNGIEYHHIPVPDVAITPISPEKYDAIYGVVKQATAEGKQVTIHCGAGDGRTGTALAALKLRELLENEAKENQSILDSDPENTALVHATFVTAELPCTPLVKQAVEAVRNDREASSDNGSHSVETKNDIQTLIDYERHLRPIIKEELRVKQGQVESPVAIEIAPITNSSIPTAQAEKMNDTTICAARNLVDTFKEQLKQSRVTHEVSSNVHSDVPEENREGSDEPDDEPHVSAPNTV